MENIKFEDLMNKINEIVSKLEDEKIEIDDAIKLFEEGTKLTAIASKKLNDIKSRAMKVISDNSKDNNDNKTK